MNIIYTLTNRGYSIIKGLAFTALGIALLLWPASMLDTIVQLIAAFMILTALGSMLYMHKQKKEREADGESEGKSFISSFATMNVLFNIIFGTLIFLFPSFFVSILVFLFGFILLFLGLSQFANLFLSGRYVKTPAVLYLLPAIITICGIILFFQPFTAKDVLTMFFGACTAAYGITELVSVWIFRKVKFTPDGKFIRPKDNVMEAEYEEVEITDKEN